MLLDLLVLNLLRKCSPIRQLVISVNKPAKASVASKTTILCFCLCFLQVIWGLADLVWARLSGSACHYRSVGLLRLLCFMLLCLKHLWPRYPLSSCQGE